MGDQKGADLGRAGTAIQDQIEGVSRFLAAQAAAGVLAAPDLAQVDLEAFAALGAGLAIIGSGRGSKRQAGFRRSCVSVAILRARQGVLW